MGIFRRGTKDTSAEVDPVMAAVGSADPDESGQPDSDLADTGAGSATTTVPSRAAASRARGPFDRSEVEGLQDRLDLGALWLTGIPGMELRLEVEQESQSVVGVTAVLGESAVQLQAFAAPRSEGIWDDIRTEIAASITSQGGTADVTSGPLGTELQARMPGQGPDGRTVFSPARFVGVDGPRWFLRAVLSGRAAIDVIREASDLSIVLMDIMMPEMDGYETMRVIRNLQEFRTLPIIALTAKAMKGDREKCLEAGASDYIAKPVNTDQLLSLMRVWLFR